MSGLRASIYTLTPCYVDLRSRRWLSLSLSRSIHTRTHDTRASRGSIGWWWCCTFALFGGRRLLLLRRVSGRRVPSASPPSLGSRRPTAIERSTVMGRSGVVALEGLILARPHGTTRAEAHPSTSTARSPAASSSSARSSIKTVGGSWRLFAGRRGLVPRGSASTTPAASASARAGDTVSRVRPLRRWRR